MRPKRFTSLVTACLLSLTGTISNAQNMAGETHITEGNAPGITNYSTYQGPETFAGKFVGFGGATEPEAMEWLKQQGYVTVISLRLSDEDGAEIESSQSEAEKFGLNYVHLPFNPKEPTPDLENDFLAAASKASNQPIYLYCGSATRAAIFWMLGRAQQDDIDKSSAETEGTIIAEKPEEAIEFFSARIAAGTEK